MSGFNKDVEIEQEVAFICISDLLLINAHPVLLGMSPWKHIDTASRAWLGLPPAWMWALSWFIAVWPCIKMDRCPRMAQRTKTNGSRCLPAEAVRDTSWGFYSSVFPRPLISCHGFQMTWRCPCQVTSRLVKWGADTALEMGRLWDSCVPLPHIPNI